MNRATVVIALCVVMVMTIVVRRRDRADVDPLAALHDAVTTSMLPDGARGEMLSLLQQRRLKPSQYDVTA